ncbi:pteridine reductase [Biformimicrobium ophioploci]|uniref:Pteridine reductase n=1 Tax=Biformimicrobium ophioploci TaxID=3036711 RepID=A0ABQ6LUH3_9GAMM|nr:pteridine reductase [Microbulbifer sp. NKW57]GMG85738.1 pteridine reductase [Microbulbifer sp. NKW57]
MTERVALITGAANRLGKAMAEALHQDGFNVVIHFRNSGQAAASLIAGLNRVRADSAAGAQADLCTTGGPASLATQALKHWGRLDLLINNASSFFPTPLDTATEAQWDDLIGSNLKAPFFLCQALVDSLSASGGSIVNLVDIHAQRPMPNHPIYSAAKAGLAMLTKSLAVELAPRIRVNGIAPGAVLWPEHHGQLNTPEETILSRTPLRRTGEPADIVAALRYLVDAPYVTGQILAVDGGRSLTI